MQIYIINTIYVIYYYYEDLHQAILKSKDYLLKKANTISLNEWENKLSYNQK